MTDDRTVQFRKDVEKLSLEELMCLKTRLMDRLSEIHWSLILGRCSLQDQFRMLRLDNYCDILDELINDRKSGE